MSACDMGSLCCGTSPCAYLAVDANAEELAALRAENAAIKAEAAECAAELAAYTRDLRAMAAVLTKGGEDFAALKREVERLRGALEVISVQRTTEQMDDDERHDADFEFAYDAIVGTARAALAHKEPGDES